MSKGSKLVINSRTAVAGAIIGLLLFFFYKSRFLIFMILKSNWSSDFGSHNRRWSEKTSGFAA